MVTPIGVSPPFYSGILIGSELPSTTHTSLALSYTDNRMGMAIVAYNGDQPDVIRRWDRVGARHLSRIEYDKEKCQVSFFGEYDSVVRFRLAELKVRNT